MIQLDYPNDKEVMDKFDCMDKVSFRYAFSSFSFLVTRGMVAARYKGVMLDGNGCMWRVKVELPQEHNAGM